MQQKVGELMRDLTAEGWTSWDTNAFMTYIGPMWRREVDGWPEYGLLTDERHSNTRGIVHGGVIMSFLDYTIGATVHQLTDGQPNVTVHLDTQFLDAGEIGDLLTGRCEIERQGRSLCFVRGVIRNEKTVVATASGVWKMMKPRNAAEKAQAEA